MPKKLTLPAPPVVPTQPTTGNLQDWAQKLVSWALDTRGKIETWSVNNGYLGVVTAEDTYAALAGNSSQTFSVADASTSHEAVALEQVNNVTPVGATNTATGTSVSVTTASITAPSKGAFVIFAYYWADQNSGISTQTLTASLSGLATVTPFASNFPSSIEVAQLPVTSGQSSTFTASLTNATSVVMSVQVAAFFLPLV